MKAEFLGLLLCAALLFASGSHSALAEGLSAADVFPSDRVLDVQITVAEEDWDTIRHQSRNILKELGAERKEGPLDHPYTYVNASVMIDGVKFPEVGIRKKGFIGSQSKTRPSLKIKLNHVDKEGGIEGMTNLTLNNNKQDTSQMSQFMGYALFNAAGSSAPRCAYAKVSVNGEELGVYSHVEAMRRPFCLRAFGSDKGALYEGTVVDFHEGWEKSFEEKFGKDKPGRKKINQLIEVLRDRDSAELEKAIGELVDLDAFYTFWAVEGLLGFWDGYSGNQNNFHFYLNPETDKLHFLPWGLDVAFTRFSKLEYDPEAPLSVKTKGLIAHKLYQLKSGRERYAKTLRGILDKHWNENELIAETVRIEKLVLPHLEASQRKSFRSMEETREFIQTRKKELLAEIADGMPVWARVPGEPPVITDEMFGGDKNSIWAVAKRGDVAALKVHIAKGTDVNAKDGSGTTALAIAVVAGEIDAVKYLLALGADVDAANAKADTVLHGAAFLGRSEIVKLLIAKKVVLDARNNDGLTSLDIAAAPWSEEIKGIVQFIGGILQIKIDEKVVKAGREKVAALLRENGAKHGAELPKATGNLWQLAKSGDVDALEKQLAGDDGKKNVNAHDDKGITPLCWAAMTGQDQAVELLIKHGAKVNGKNKDGGTPLHAAAFLGRTSTVELLLKNDADVDARNLAGDTPLKSVAAEWSEEVKHLIQLVGGILQIDLDLKEIEDARPKIAELLRKAGKE